MSRRKVKQSNAYKVGYKRPPTGTQFKPGQSGNPNGRPKGRQSVGDILNKISRQKVTVNEGEKTKRLNAVEVMLRRLANDAMRSDQKAIKLFLSLLDRYAESHEVADQLETLLAEDEQILARYLGDQKKSSTRGKSAKPKGKNNGKK